MIQLRIVLAALCVLGTGCGMISVPGALPSPSDAARDAAGFGAATEATRRTQVASATFPLDDLRDFQDARRGRIAFEPDLRIEGTAGQTIWDSADYRFLDAPAPDTVNPSLWRQAQLNQIHGLFEVTDGVYQVRGYDLANMTVIEGDTGRILVDPLTARETAHAALRLVERSLGERPIVAVIFTHSHVDHFGGIEGVLTPEQIRGGRVRIIAPAKFIEEATSENVIAGVPMLRRADLMYGRRLPRGPRGHVDSGLGKSPAIGTAGLAVPSESIDHTPQELTIDGVRFVFQYAPDTEAPAELTFYLPDKRAYCSAEVVSRTLHNLYTLRGAKVRDALRWSAAIDEALRLFGGEAEVLFASHHWPTWGNADVVDLLKKQRDVYAYIHDQTLRLANLGHTPREIAETLELPDSLARTFANRSYYGTVRHNAKAVYQWYFGWYDGNPANLDPLPPAEAGTHYVAFMGGADAVLEKAKASFAAGEYRWAATVLDHLVFAEPQNAAAREWLARSYEQLGYRAESGPWRDVYLSGAYELRHGEPGGEGGIASTGIASAVSILEHTPLERFLGALATRLDGPRADGVELAVNFVFRDTGESYRLWIENAVLHHRRDAPDPDAHATLHLTQALLLRLGTGQAKLSKALLSGELDIDGSRTALLRFFSLLDEPDPAFAIVRP